MKSKELEIYKNVLGQIENGSTCSKYRVGAIIVKDGRIISTGWNGVPSGQLECNEFHKVLRLYKDFYNIRPLVNKNGETFKILEYLQYVYNILTSRNHNKIMYEKDIEFTSENFPNHVNLLYDDWFIFSYELPVKYNFDYTNVLLPIVEELEKLISCIKNNKEYVPENYIHSVYEIHAEQNAIAVAAKHGVSLNNAEILCNYLPCMECAKIIVQSGIKAVYYLHDYIDKRFNTRSIDFLEKSNVEVKKI